MLSPSLFNQVSDVRDGSVFLSPILPKNMPSDVIIPPVKMPAKIITTQPTIINQGVSLMQPTINPLLPNMSLPFYQPKLSDHYVDVEVAVTSPVMSINNPLNPFSQMLIQTEDIFVPNIYFNNNPLINPISYYDDVCDIDIIRNKTIEYFYFKLLDKWLYEKSKHLLGYFRVSGDKINYVESVDKKDDYKHNSQDVVDKKVSFIEKNIFSKEDISHILKKFVDSTRVSWCNLKDHGYFVREAIEKSLEKKIKRHFNA
jgi:hypothetical protein